MEIEYNDNNYHEGVLDEIRMTNLKLDKWMVEHDIYNWLTPYEYDLFERDFCDPSSSEMDQMSFSTEAFGILLWASGHTDILPSHLDLYCYEDFDDAVKSMNDLNHFLSTSSLRPIDQLIREFHRSKAVATRGIIENHYLLGDINLMRRNYLVKEISRDLFQMRLIGDDFQNDLIDPEIYDIAFIGQNALARTRALGWILNLTPYWDLMGESPPNSCLSSPSITFN